MRNFFLNSYDSTPLYVRVWDTVALAKGLVLVCHDIGEHSGRYAELARYLQSKNMVVVAYDQRSFGASAKPETIGHGNDNTYAASVQDLIFLYRYYEREFGLPMFIVGHGYGARIALSTMQLATVKPKAVLLSGIGLAPQANLRLMLSVLSGLPQKDKSSPVRKQQIAAWDAKVDGKDGDYLTTDDERLDSYRNDPLCGVVPTIALHHGILQGVLSTTRQENIDNMDRQVCYALLVGMNDPCLGKEGEDALGLLLKMRQAKFAVRFFGYEGARHDILQEKLRTRFYQHIQQYLLSVL